jgi:carbamate kinase
VVRVYLNFGETEEKPLSSMTVNEAVKYLNEGHFPPGSMGPKIKAAINYINKGGKEVLITSSNYLKSAMINRSGTKIKASNEEKSLC